MKDMRLILVVAVLMAAVGSASAANVKVKKSKLARSLEGKTPQEQLLILQDTKETKKNAAELFYLTGNAYFSLGEIDSAIVNYEKTVAADPEHVKALVNMGIAQEEKNHEATAIQWYRRALKVAPDDVLALCHLGGALLIRNEVNEAVDLIQRAIELDPESPQAHYNLGLAFADLKVFHEALVEWRLVVKLDHNGDLGRLALENVQLILKFADQKGTRK